MKRIFFLDHGFHRRTGSSAFFVELLRESFEVDVAYVEGAGADFAHLIDRAMQSDCAVLWQLDHLAPVFLSQGLPTVVVPMFDGSSMMPDLHWLWSRQASFINFSFSLHERVRRLGNRSRLVKYFKPPVADTERARFHNGLRVFLWQRRPEHGVNLHLIERLFGGALKSVHIHDAPDDPKLDSTPYLARRLDGYGLSVSRWFSDISQYEQILRRHNVFVAPRRSEGIGMALLEAMSRGMLVAAADFPTHTEYVANRVNGVLFHPDHTGLADFSDAASMGRLAWRTAAQGHADWLAARPRIAHMIRATQAPSRTLEVDPVSFAQAITRAHGGGDGGYAAYLLQNLTAIETMSGQALLGRVTGSANLIPPEKLIPPPASPETDFDRRLPWLENSQIDLMDPRCDPHVVEGTMERGGGMAWMLGQGLAIGFHIDPAASRFERLRMSLSGASLEVGEQTLAVSLNGHTLGFVTLSAEPHMFECDLRPETLKSENVLRLQCSALGGTPHLASVVAAGLTDIRFS